MLVIDALLAGAGVFAAGSSATLAAATAQNPTKMSRYRIIFLLPGLRQGPYENEWFHRAVGKPLRTGLTDKSLLRIARGKNGQPRRQTGNGTAAAARAITCRVRSSAGKRIPRWRLPTLVAGQLRVIVMLEGRPDPGWQILCDQVQRSEPVKAL